jgi:hypothetical protein
MIPLGPSTFVLGVTWLFALATLATGVLALVQIGYPSRSTPAGSSGSVRRPSCVRPTRAAGERDRWRLE